MTEQIESPMAKNIREAAEKIAAMSQEEFNIFWEKHCKEWEVNHDPTFTEFCTQALNNAKE